LLLPCDWPVIPACDRADLSCDSWDPLPMVNK
jgi:hypothetical protein